MKSWDCFLVTLSIPIAVIFIFWAFYIYKKNCRNRLGDQYCKKEKFSVRKFIHKIGAAFQRTFEELSKKKKAQDTQAEKQDMELKRLTWFTEFQPFILVCIASILLPNALFVIADELNIKFPSPLSYENTLLLIVPLAWTVGIAFFQYRIQNELILSQLKEKEVENKQKLQQQQEHRTGELISALSSLCVCDFSVVNFYTKSVSLSRKRNFSFVNDGINSEVGYAVEIVNKTGAPCFYFPYYIFEGNISSGVTIKLEGKTIKEKYCFILPNEVYIFIPRDLKNFFVDESDTEDFLKKIREFFVWPSFGTGLGNNKLQCSITIHAEDPFYHTDDQQGKGLTSLIQYTMLFQLEPFGGYCSDGSFPLKMTNYAINDIK